MEAFVVVVIGEKKKPSNKRASAPSNSVPKNKIARLVVARVRAAGFKPVVVGGRGYRVAWSDAEGRRHVVPVGRSPSNASTEKSALRLFNRACMEADAN